MIRAGRTLAPVFAGLAAMLLVACASSSYVGAPKTMQTALYRHVEALSADSFGGRAPGSKGEQRTLTYLQEQWQAAGLKSGTHDPAHPWRAPVHYDFRGQNGTTANLIGRIPGSDPAAGAVLLLAHWDHLGKGAPRCPRRGLDRICNGAIDNASGLAVITETARALAAGPQMTRDVYVLATSAEELGLAGAAAFAANPPVPLARFVAAFNVDTEGISPDGCRIVVIGPTKGPLVDLVHAVAAENGMEVVDPAAANARFYRRQDGWLLNEAGLPAVLVSAAFAESSLMDAYLARDYHGPHDEVGLAVLGGAARMVELHTALVRAAADPVRFPARAP